MRRTYMTADVFTERAGVIERIRIGGRCVEVMHGWFDLVGEG